MAGTVAEDPCGAVACGLPARLPFGCRAALVSGWPGCSRTRRTGLPQRRASLLRCADPRRSGWPSRRGAVVEVPSGTVGGRIACANTPACSAASHRAVAARGSPTISGMIGVSPAGTSKPQATSSSLSTAELPRRRSTITGWSRRIRSAAPAAATAGGGSAVEKISVRARLTRNSAMARSQHANAP